jgi:peptidoglycan/xylan/chitin deacetylase (PgdA/CDA1 family)
MFLLFHDVYSRHPGESGYRSPAADRYKLRVDAFERLLAALSAAAAALPFGLTFDDGGVSFYTHAADRVEQLGWRARCFVPTDAIGQAGFLSAPQLRELDRRGHAIGSHSASHPSRMSALPFASIAEEWRRSVRALEDILGHAVTTASVPGGYHSRAVEAAAAGAGIRMLLTSEPVTRPWRRDDCIVAGRFPLRHDSAPDLAARLAGRAPWARWAAWADWNAKALVKPLLGSAYPRIADWLMAQEPPATERTAQENNP